MTALALGIPLAAITLLGLLLNLYIILVVILSKQVGAVVGTHGEASMAPQ